MLTREQILQAARKPRAVEELPIPEWGFSVWVRDIGAGGRDRLEEAIGKAGTKTLEGVRAHIAVACVTDGSGLPLLKVEDVPILNEAASAPIQRIFEVASRLNRFTKEEVDQLAKNSETGLASDF